MRDRQEPQLKGSRGRRAIGLILGLLLLCIGAEAGLRLYSFLTGGPVLAFAKATPQQSFVFLSDDPWVFDAKHGFVGKPNLKFIVGSVSNGRDVSYSDLPSSLWPPPQVGPDWQGADLKISLFGADDATYQPEWNRTPWPTILAEELSKQAGKRVAIANYSRPGVGLVQSLVLAAELAPANKSDLVLLVPSTSTLAMEFVHRAVLQVDGATLPFLSSSSALANDPTVGLPTGAIINPQITKSWCRQVQSVARRNPGLLAYDDLLRELQNQADVAAFVSREAVTTDWYSRESALVRLLRGQFPPFGGLRPMLPEPPHYLADPNLEHDGRVTQAVTALRNAGIEIRAMVSPVFPELPEHRFLLQHTGVPQRYVDTLLGSFGRLAGQDPLRMIDALDHDVRPEGAALVNNPEGGDWQLRAAGVDLYAALAAKTAGQLVAAVAKK